MSVTRKLLLVTSVALQLVLPFAPAWAQGPWPVPVEDPLLASLIDEALSKNPDVAAARLAAIRGGVRVFKPHRRFGADRQTHCAK